MNNNLPECMYDYRPSIYENNDMHTNVFCERCGEEITEQEYDEYDGYCYDCNEQRDEENE